MYINQIDDIIDKVLDKLYLEGLSKKNPFSMIIEEKKINFMEYHEQINKFMQSFMDGLDTEPIQKVINNKENLQLIINIIKRYVAYYCFLYMAFYYAGTIKDFRNNLIQLSKLQETYAYHIKNFFDTENNYQLIVFFKIIADSKKILLMTELQRKTIGPGEMTDAVKFLNKLGLDYIDSYLLGVKGEGDDQTVEINVHNFIKTIVFGDIYKNQEQMMVFKILSDIEESENEYIWIEIVVSSHETIDFNFFQSIFEGEINGDFLGLGLYELISRPPELDHMSNEKKNNFLLKTPFVHPVVDDFLRFHKDTEKLDFDHDNTFVLSHFNKSNAKNVQLVLIKQHKKKKENTKAQLIINKVDMIVDLYSENVKNNEEVQREIKRFFYGPLLYRKVVLHNYLDEMHVLRKMLLQGRKMVEKDEYYLELKFITTHAYFNFKDFQKYGASIILSQHRTLNMIRHCNVEYIDQYPGKEIETRTGIYDSTINMTGLSIGPFIVEPLQCMMKEDLVDIRKVKIIYQSDGKLKEVVTENGYKAFMKIIKHYYVGTISLDGENLVNDFTPFKKINPDILTKVIYWTYNPDVDIYVIDTYENIKSYDFQENIRFMNSVIYDKIMGLLKLRLIWLIGQNEDFSSFQVEKLIQGFIQRYNLVVSPNDIRDLLIKNFLSKRRIDPVNLIEITEHMALPDFIEAKKSPDNLVFYIKLDLTHPLNIKEYESMESYLGKEGLQAPKLDAHCRHEADWLALSKLRRKNLNEYNDAITQFIYKYAVETADLYFVCRLCSKFLPMKEYFQDGKYNNATQRYTTNYVPTYIPLDEIKEYGKYTRTINHLDGLCGRISLITGTTMLTGATVTAKLKRKTIIKNTIDIILKHNSVMMKSDTLDTAAYSIDKNISTVFYFELDDRIYDVTPETATPREIEINRLKFNLLILYFIWIFITELNPVQILTMNTDKIANIYIIEKYSEKIFENLLLKKNINGNEKVKITEYPVLCYVLYLLSYFIVKYGIWYAEGKSTKVFNAFIIKTIIHSLVELFDGFVVNLSRMENDYVYGLVLNKIYTQLNSLYKNTDIIRLLKERQFKYAEKGTVAPAAKEVVKKPFILPLIKFTFKVSTGIIMDDRDGLVYTYIPNNTNLTNCPSGQFHHWVPDPVTLHCTICGESDADLPTNINDLIDRTTPSYYFNMERVATRKCADCKINEFSKAICDLCKDKKEFTHADLKLIDTELINLELAAYEKNMLYINREQAKTDAFYIEGDKLVKELAASPNNKVDEFINRIEELVGSQVNFGTESKPLYLRYDVYIIDHSYLGLKLSQPITFTEASNKVSFKEDHPYFHTDVFYYTNNENGSVDVFYHAITMKLIGYKEKHKEYVLIKRTNDYLIINRSIKNKLLNLGFSGRYLDISKIRPHTADKTLDQTYYSILDNLIKLYIFTLRQIVDKVISIMSKITNFDPKEEKTVYVDQKVEMLVAKYANLIKDFTIGTQFDSWNYIRDSLSYVEVDWPATNVRPNNSQFINSDVISHNCPQQNQMFHFLLSNMLVVLGEGGDRINKINIANLYIELITFVYDLYNRESIERTPDLKRFDYIVNGSIFMWDLLRKGRGLINKELEEFNVENQEMGEIEIAMTKEAKAEMEEATEASEALDVESPSYEEENEDYANYEEAEE